MQETDWWLPELRGWEEEKRGNGVKGTCFQVYEKWAWGCDVQRGDRQRCEWHVSQWLGWYI